MKCSSEWSFAPSVTFTDVLLSTSSPYLSSPVKQKVQAFEKHAVQGGSGTPTKYNTMPAKYVRIVDVVIVVDWHN